MKNQPRTKRIVDKVKQYESSVVVMLEGNDRRVSNKHLQGGAKLKQLLKKELEEARREAMKLNPSQFGKDIEVRSSHFIVRRGELVDYLDTRFQRF